MRARWVVLLVAATFVVACSPTNQGQPTSSPPPPTTTTLAHIDGFPDMSNYTEDTSGSYEAINRPRIQGFFFSTPNGLICVSNAYPDVEYETVGCRGLMPHEGPGVWSVNASRGQQTTVESITGDPTYAADVKDPPPVLPPMHKLNTVAGDAVCAVDDNGMTACRIGVHGFVITPTSTQLF